MSVVANVAINIDGKQAAAILDDIKRKVEAMNGTFDKVPNAAKKVNGLGSALVGLVGQFATVATAIATVQKGLTTAFERGVAEQRLKNLASSTGEYEAALGVAAATADKFGMSQTEATKALADIYSRLKGVGFGLKETSQIYDGFNVIAKQSGIAGEEAAGVFFQLSQALGKGKLNGDEFVSVSERMPQLLDAIAQATGRSRGELSQMAQDGQITSDVLFKALSGSAAAAGDLNGKLTEQQKAFNAVGQVSDRLLNSIGQVFAPVVIKGAEALATIGQKLAEWWSYLGDQVLPKFLAAIKPATDAFQQLWSQIPWDTIVGYIQGAILVGIDRIILAVKILSPLVGFVVTKFAELAQNPVFQFIAEQVGRVAQLLGLSNTEVSKFTEGQKASEQAAAGTVNQYSSMPVKIENAKEKTKELKAAQDAVTKSITRSSEAINKSTEQQLSGLGRVLSVTNARIQAEKAINNVLLEQAQRQLDGAVNQGERVKAAGRILEVTIEQAKLEKESAYASIEAEEIKLDIAVSAAKLKQKEVELAVELAKIQGSVLQAHYDTLNAATELVDQAIKQRAAGSEIAKYQKQAADANFASAKSAAKAAYQGNIAAQSSTSLASNTNSAAQSAEQYASSMQNAAAAINTIDPSKTVGFLPAAGGTFTAYGGAGGIKDEAKRAEMMQLFNDINTRNARLGAGSRVNANAMEGFSQTVRSIIKQENMSNIPAFAEGGVVTKPTLGLIGEAGTEYIVPESKAADFATNYLSRSNNPIGDSGGKAPVINITTGPVMEQNGQRYVTIQDMERALQTVSAGVFSNARTAGGRRYQGVR